MKMPWDKPRLWTPDTFTQPCGGGNREQPRRRRIENAADPIDGPERGYDEYPVYWWTWNTTWNVSPDKESWQKTRHRG